MRMHPSLCQYLWQIGHSLLYFQQLFPDHVPACTYHQLANFLFVSQHCHILVYTLGQCCGRRQLGSREPSIRAKFYPVRVEPVVVQCFLAIVSTWETSRAWLRSFLVPWQTVSNQCLYLFSRRLLILGGYFMENQHIKKGCRCLAIAHSISLVALVAHG